MQGRPTVGDIEQRTTKSATIDMLCRDEAKRLIDEMRGRSLLY